MIANSSVGRGKRRRTAGAIAASLAAHLLVLGILASSRPSLTDDNVGQPAISVDLVRQELLEPRRRKSIPPAAGPARTKTPLPPPPSAPHARETETAELYATPTLPMAPGAPRADERLGAALRGSLLGCVDGDTARLTPSERQHCHDRYALRNKEGPVFGVDPKRSPSSTPTRGARTFSLNPSYRKRLRTAAGRSSLTRTTMSQTQRRKT